jgi:von Willebrand factor type A domain
VYEFTDSIEFESPRDYEPDSFHPLFPLYFDDSLPLNPPHYQSYLHCFFGIPFFSKEVSMLSSPTTRQLSLFIFFAIFALGSGCAANSDDERPRSQDEGEDEGEGEGEGEGDNEDFPNDSDTNQSTDSEVCGEFDFNIEFVPTRLMILLDMSGSMLPTKWTQAKTALLNLMTIWQNKTEIEFGFDIFPNNKTICEIDQPVVTDCVPGTSNTQAISSFLQTGHPEGGTPLCAAIQNFDADQFPNYAPEFTSNDASSYLLIVSDGDDSCGGLSCDGPPMNPGAPADKLGELAANMSTKGIKTLVIGFGSLVANSKHLKQIAANGDSPFTTPINAANQAELEQAFEDIAAAVVGCVYEVEQPPEGDVDPDNVNFYFDGDVVPGDPDCALGVGWTWTDDDPPRVEFCEEACNELQSGSVSTVSAKFGCPTQAPV